jgi:hypothetical protein
VKILGYITSAKIGYGLWHGTAENFILNWQEQIRLYERLTPTAGHFSVNKSSPCYRLLFILFKNFVRSRLLPHCSRSIPIRNWTYDAYSNLLLSTASDSDSKHVVNKGKRPVYAHEMTHEDDDVYDASYEMDRFDIDTPVDTIKAFASKFTTLPGMNERIRMPKDNGLV